MPSDGHSEQNKPCASKRKPRSRRIYGRWYNVRLRSRPQKSKELRVEAFNENSTLQRNQREQDSSGNYTNTRLNQRKSQREDLRFVYGLTRLIILTILDLVELFLTE